MAAGSVDADKQNFAIVFTKQPTKQKVNSHNKIKQTTDALLMIKMISHVDDTEVVYQYSLSKVQKVINMCVGWLKTTLKLPFLSS